MRQYESYKCNKCGNIVELSHLGGGELHCCGEKMECITTDLTSVVLMKAFAGESMARNKYEFFAKIAFEEGLHKIAKFFQEAADNEKRNIIFVSVVEMARKLNISLVVEGVETGENVSLMRECGCNIAQGYYFARPMEESKFAELFREGKLC